MLLSIEMAQEQLGWSEAEIRSGLHILRVGRNERVSAEDVRRARIDGWKPVRSIRELEVGTCTSDAKTLLAIRYLTERVEELERRVALLAVKRRKVVPNELRMEILKRDQFLCRYCGVGLRKFEASIDHVIPWIAGGTSEPENLVASCRACNARKGMKSLEEAGLEILPIGTKRELALNQPVKAAEMMNSVLSVLR